MLHGDWCAAGFDPDAFWRQTPLTFESAMRGVGDRRRAEAERDVALAHATAQFTRAKKLEPLERYLPRRSEPGQRGSLLDRLKTIAVATGGTITED